MTGATTCTHLAVRCTTLGAGEVARLGIYAGADDGDGALIPGDLILDAGTVDLASTGLKEITLSPMVLEPGWYFAAWSQDGSTARLTVAREASAGNADAATPPVGGSTDSANLNNGTRSCMAVAVVDGGAALPDPAPAPTIQSNSRAAVWFRTHSA